MRHHKKRKLSYLLVYAIIHVFNPVSSKNIQPTNDNTLTTIDDSFDNNIINFEEDFSEKLSKKYGAVPWHSTDKFNRDSLRYTVDKDLFEKKDAVKDNINKKHNDTQVKNQDVSQRVEETTLDYGVIPLELISTTENILVRIIDSTTEPDLTVIPLSTTKKVTQVEIKQTVTIPVSTQSTDITTEYTSSTENDDEITTVSENHETTTSKREVSTEIVIETPKFKEYVPKPNQTKEVKVTTVSVIENSTKTTKIKNKNDTVVNKEITLETTTIKHVNKTNIKEVLSNMSDSQKNITQQREEEKPNKTISVSNVTLNLNNETKLEELLKTNSSRQVEKLQPVEFESSEFLEDFPLFTELDTEEEDVPEDYYDAKDVVPTTAPKTDALSVIFGLAGSVVESVVESVAERVVPKGIYDLFKRMQRQNEALEAERLRSREENGGIGQFTRGILKSLSTGLSKPLSQLMAGVKDIGSLDTDRGFVSSLASGVTSVATSVASVADAFKDKVQAIYPGTVWCGDGHSATARSSDLGLFFFTDTCCRQHDACKIFIKAGETKYGLTNTGLFTRSHCSCDAKFRECLRRTNSLVSAQIGLTYFNVLGPQCFRKAHPIVKCVRRTRITGQKCEEYELDYTKPKMWQWFDNETF